MATIQINCSDEVSGLSVLDTNRFIVWSEDYTVTYVHDGVVEDVDLGRACPLADEFERLVAEGFDEYRAATPVEEALIYLVLGHTPKQVA